MNTLHAFWLADRKQFIQFGYLYFWIESKNNFCLDQESLAKWLQSVLKFKQSPLANIKEISFMLPDKNNTLVTEKLFAYQVDDTLKFLKNIDFYLLHQEEYQVGQDLAFWIYISELIQNYIIQERYIPRLVYYNQSIYTGWEYLSQDYEAIIDKAVAYMPFSAMGRPYTKKSLLKHFMQVVLQSIVENTPWPQNFLQKVDKTILQEALQPPFSTQHNLDTYKQWLVWYNQLSSHTSDAHFYLGFQLQEPEEGKEIWDLNFILIARSDLSFKVSLAEYWHLNQKDKNNLSQYFGNQTDVNLLQQLGQAARLYNLLWQGLENDKPSGIHLNTEQAFHFLKETAWLLQDAGFKVIIPSWYTPEGRMRAKLKLKTEIKTENNKPKGYLSLDNLKDYHYDLAIGDENVTPEEWQQLVKAKMPLVLFRGKWIEIESKRMEDLFDFWQQQAQEDSEPQNLPHLLQQTLQDDVIAFDEQDELFKVLELLNNPSKITTIEQPLNIKATLRPYQLRGISWLQYLENIGLNGCLADDMGLGKTLQMISHITIQSDLKPTLLIAPTSVLGNWQKEVERFAPDLKTYIHHGGKREIKEAGFKEKIKDYHIIITSFNLARKDLKLFKAVDWQRIVLDEAQNIKNPQANQTKSIYQIPAQHRWALTGTPVENRLMDLWSLFQFLQPGYLNTQAQFRKQFEIPIQKDNDAEKAEILKRLTAPFILRRVKTDPSIIRDLPDKIEHKQYCHLTKEQASLYQAVVTDVEAKLEKSEDNKGLMLSTLMRLKQICNHPMQFLQDKSEFSAQRSHKLQRLHEMLEEVMAENESALVFTQFTELGENLLEYMYKLNYTAYYLHGGINRTKREKMITQFQDPDSPPSIFILSLKAAGVGITLTKANHVFHFDRWWNPAVEEQATDRAFRIGQKKNVFVHKFITLGTLEERIDQMISDKKAMAGAIIGQDESWLSQLDNESFKKLIQLQQTVWE